MIVMLKTEVLGINTLGVSVYVVDVEGREIVLLSTKPTVNTFLE